MTLTRPAPTRRGALTDAMIRGALSVKPLWAVAKHQARRMMIQRAERHGIPWSARVAAYERLDWAPHWQAVHDPAEAYPANDQASFHGYDAGHLCWQAAIEFEVASNAVHSSLYPEAGAASDQALRVGYHQALLVRPGGWLAVMDMNPACQAYQTMPAAVMTLLKSTEPFLDAYFAFDLEEELRLAGFDTVTSSPCTPRHRAVLAQVAP
ncbi:MAG: hypothetical protein ACKO28_09905 [Cyanobium sp.]